MTFVTLPSRPKPNAAQPTLIDKGGIMRGSSALRIDRPGNHYAISFQWPREAMEPDVARTFTGRLQRAKRNGLQFEIPLLVEQGIPGEPVVDGAVTGAATSIDITGFTPFYIIREGYWLTISESDGSAYLHSVVETVVADDDGNATVEIEPPLRAPFADGDSIEFARPFMQGFIASDNFSWSIDGERRADIAIDVEEYR